MRVAILSDIHGNIIGLDAVLAHIEARGGVDEYWFLGDYCFGGSAPHTVLERLHTLRDVQAIYGNADEIIFNRDFQFDPLTPDNAQWQIELTRDIYWTIGRLTTSQLDWLAALPLEIRITLPNGSHVLLVHSQPGSHRDTGLLPVQSDDEVRQCFASAAEQLIFVGHTHMQQERCIDDKHIVNPGCIGKPITTNPNATYTLLTADEKGYVITQHQVEYDMNAVIADLYSKRYPGADYMAHFYRGEYVPPWLHPDTP